MTTNHLSGAEHVDFSSLPPDALIRLPDVLRLYPVSRSHFMDGCRSGIYPRPTKAGLRLNASRLGDILALCRGEWRTDDYEQGVSRQHD